MAAVVVVVVVVVGDVAARKPRPGKKNPLPGATTMAKATIRYVAIKSGEKM